MIRAQAIKTARLGISNFSTSALRLRQPRLVLYTGTDCQLCEVAKAVLDEAHREVPFELELYNIRDDSLPEVMRWRRAYQYDIPVLHLEGSEIARHRLDKAQLLDKLRRASAEVEDEPRHPLSHSAV